MTKMGGGQGWAKREWRPDPKTGEWSCERDRCLPGCWLSLTDYCRDEDTDSRSSITQGFASSPSDEWSVCW